MPTPSMPRRMTIDPWPPESKRQPHRSGRQARGNRGEALRDQYQHQAEGRERRLDLGDERLRLGWRGRRPIGAWTRSVEDNDRSSMQMLAEKMTVPRRPGRRRAGQPRCGPASKGCARRSRTASAASFIAIQGGDRRGRAAPWRPRAAPSVLVVDLQRDSHSGHRLAQRAARQRLCRRHRRPSRTTSTSRRCAACCACRSPTGCPATRPPRRSCGPASRR